MNEEFDPAVQPAEPVTAADIPEMPAEQAAPPAEPAPAAEAPAPEADVPFPAAEAPVPAEPVPAPQPVYPAPEAPRPAAPVFQQPPVSPNPQQPVQPAYPYGAGETPRVQEPRPGRKSPYAPMSSFGMAVQLFLMNIPVLGLILSIVWACGVGRKIARRNLARAWLILLIVGIVLLVAGILVLRFCFPDELVRAFEQAFPGYTIKWG